jgi:hypothetical protein
MPQEESNLEEGSKRSEIAQGRQIWRPVSVDQPWSSRWYLVGEEKIFVTGAGWVERGSEVMCRAWEGARVSAAAERR